MVRADDDKLFNLLLERMEHTVDATEDVEPTPAVSPPLFSPPEDADIWLDGDVIVCRCPGCGAAVPVRHWLMLADCLRCGTSIELSEEQEAKVRLLVEELLSSKPGVAPPPLPDSFEGKGKAAPKADAPSEEKETSTAPQVPVALGARAVPFGEKAADPEGKEPKYVDRHTQRRSRRKRYGSFFLFLVSLFNNLPAWLLSILVHLLIVALLGAWIVAVEDTDKKMRLILSPRVDENLMEEGDIEEEPNHEEIDVPQQFEPVDPGSETIAEEMANQEREADKTAEEELLTPPEEPEFVYEEAPLPSEVELSPRIMPTFTKEFAMPTINTFSSTEPAVGNFTMTQANSMFKGRTPAMRKKLLEASGGTTETEAAVARALAYLASHQRPDGSWSFNRPHYRESCDKSCRQGNGYCSNDMGATAMALLPFLGAGQTQKEGPYKEVVQRGLDWITRSQGNSFDPNERDNVKRSGSLMYQDNNSGMYSHGLAAIVLSEAYALTGDPNLRLPAARAIFFTETAQNSEGGWRYKPGERGDTSVVGWQMMALQSAKQAGFRLDRQTLPLATRFLESVKSKSEKYGERYGYTSANDPSLTMTSVGALCKLYLGAPTNSPSIRRNVRLFTQPENLPTLENLKKNKRTNNLYYWYYATQVVHHVGGEDWNKWNNAMQQSLLASQEKNGHSAGSWNLKTQWSREGGKLYSTALAACMLEVYYRHIPLYYFLDDARKNQPVAPKQPPLLKQPQPAPQPRPQPAPVAPTQPQPRPQPAPVAPTQPQPRPQPAPVAPTQPQPRPQPAPQPTTSGGV